MGEMAFDQVRIQQAKQRRKLRERFLIIGGAIVLGICLGVGSAVLIVFDGGCGTPFFSCDSDDIPDDGGL
jgi:hypothetical protein